MFILHIIYTQNRIPKCFLNMECNKTNIQRRERIQNLFLYSTREYSFIHSFIPCNYFILVRAAMDSESIPGTLGPRWKYTQVGTPIHHRVPCTHKSTHSFTINGNLWYPMHICMFLGLGGNQRTHRTEPGPGALGRLENTSIILIKEGAPSLILP